MTRQVESEEVTSESLQDSDGDLLSPEAAKMVMRDARFPWFYVLALLLMWTGVTVLAMARGGGGAPSFFGIECGGPQFIGLLVGSTVFLLVFLALSALYVGRDHVARVRAMYPFKAGDVLWTRTRLLLFPSLFLFVGLLAGFVGVGGGLLQGPIFMRMGCDPRVAVATTAFLVLFTTSSSLVQFFAFGKMRNWPLVRDSAAVVFSLTSVICFELQGLWYFGLGAIAAFLGQFLIGRLVAHYRRPSLLCVALALVTFSSLVALLAVRLPEIVHHFSPDFGSPCHPAGTANSTAVEYAFRYLLERYA